MATESKIEKYENIKSYQRCLGRFIYTISEVPTPNGVVVRKFTRKLSKDGQPIKCHQDKNPYRSKKDANISGI